MLNSPTHPSAYGSSPTLIVVPTKVRLYLNAPIPTNRFNGDGFQTSPLATGNEGGTPTVGHPLYEVLTPTFLASRLTIEDWRNWYRQQRIIGNISLLEALMPGGLSRLFQDELTKEAKSNNLRSNIMRESTAVTDTSPIDVAIQLVSSTQQAHSQYAVMFTGDIQSVPYNRFMKALGRGLLSQVGIETYSRINHGLIFKKVMELLDGVPST